MKYATILAAVHCSAGCIDSINFSRHNTDEDSHLRIFSVWLDNNTNATSTRTANSTLGYC